MKRPTEFSEQVLLGNGWVAVLDRFYWRIDRGMDVCMAVLDRWLCSDNCTNALMKGTKGANPQRLFGLPDGEVESTHSANDTHACCEVQGGLSSEFHPS